MPDYLRFEGLAACTYSHTAGVPWMPQRYPPSVDESGKSLQIYLVAHAQRCRALSWQSGRDDGAPEFPAAAGRLPLVIGHRFCRAPPLPRRFTGAVIVCFLCGASCSSASMQMLTSTPAASCCGVCDVLRSGAQQRIFWMRQYQHKTSSAALLREKIHSV